MVMSIDQKLGSGNLTKSERTNLKNQRYETVLGLRWAAMGAFYGYGSN